MSEPAQRLATALDRLRVGAIRAFARRHGLALAAEDARDLVHRLGPARSAELLRLVARLPRPFQSLLLRILLRARGR
jgi:hypothetical protein